LASGAVAAIGVDGGNSKTDAVLVASDGRLLAGARGPTCSHEALGMERVVRAMAVTLGAACERAGHELRPGLARAGGFCLAGADLPVDERHLAARLAEAGWTARTVLRNDTFAVLRAGSERGVGVAVVCGAGINASGVGPDGRQARFAAMGDVSGDFGGGMWLATSGLGAAVRARDGRGGRTVLEERVPKALGYGRPSAVLTAIRTGRLNRGRLLRELPPVVLEAAAAGDPVAGAIVDRLADEVVTMALALLRRLGLVRAESDVVLGGGVFRSGDRRLVGRVTEAIGRAAPRATVSVLNAPPVLGAALLALDELDAGGDAEQRLRAELRPEALVPVGGSPGRRDGGMVAAYEEVDGWQG
jgi:N-acetylglucosamine kinase-like BadF-type ATPase